MTKPKLAVFVDEPETGVFCWVLLEGIQHGTIFTSIEVGKQFFPNWTAALEAGNARLFQVVQSRESVVH